MKTKIIKLTDSIYENKDQRVSEDSLHIAADFLSKALGIDLSIFDKIVIEEPLKISVSTKQKARIAFDTIAATLLFTVLSMTLFKNSPALTISIGSASSLLSSIISYNNNSKIPAYYNKSAFFPNTPGTKDSNPHIRLSKDDARRFAVPTLIHETVHYLGRLENSPLGKNSDRFLANALETIYMTFNKLRFPLSDTSYNFKMAYKGEIFYHKNHQKENFFELVRAELMQIIDLDQIEWRDAGMFICGIARALKEDNRQEDIFILLAYLGEFDYPAPGSYLSESVAAHNQQNMTD